MRSGWRTVMVLTAAWAVIIGWTGQTASGDEDLTVGPLIVGPATRPTATNNAQRYTVLQQFPDRLVVELPNRMVVIAQEIHAAPVVSAQVWIKTGSIYEQQHVGAGLSHFLEHLLAGGSTTTRSEEASNKILGSIGAETNAQTGLDSVHYYINATSPFASKAVEQLSDWMQHSLITRRGIRAGKVGHSAGI